VKETWRSKSWPTQLIHFLPIPTQPLSNKMHPRDWWRKSGGQDVVGTAPHSWDSRPRYAQVDHGPSTSGVELLPLTGNEYCRNYAPYCVQLVVTYGKHSKCSLLWISKDNALEAEIARFITPSLEMQSFSLTERGLSALSWMIPKLTVKREREPSLRRLCGLFALTKSVTNFIQK